MARKPKAPLAAWIVGQRKAKGLKPADLAARLGVAETTIRGWETGRGISAENVGALEQLFGVSAPDAPEPSDMTALISAIGAQTEAINGLVARLDQISAPMGEIVAEWLRSQIAREAANHPGGSPAGSR